MQDVELRKSIPNDTKRKVLNTMLNSTVYVNKD